MLRVALLWPKLGTAKCCKASNETMTGEGNGTGVSCYSYVTAGVQNPAGLTRLSNEAWQKHYLCDFTYA